MKRIPKLKGVPYTTQPATIGEHLRKARVDKNMHQAEVAALLHVCEDSITGWENGRSEPRISYYKELISFIGYYPFTHETESLGGKILKYRQTHGLTRRQMGRKVGVNASAIESWEKGVNQPTKSSLEQLNTFLRNVKI